MSRQCSKVIIVILSSLLRDLLCGSLGKNLEPAPVSFTLLDEGNSKDLHTRCQDDYFVAVLEPARCGQFAPWRLGDRGRQRREEERVKEKETDRKRALRS